MLYGVALRRRQSVIIAANGKIDFYNRLGGVDLIADAVGYCATA